ncbi:uncharacterized protein PG986_011140 [Apiospora aurea]|uniref:Uncharacterized protein n=1 Tax=Apiospora aurea TaxID=335848 RepID=A0ABR1Q473_9PEZI
MVPLRLLKRWPVWPNCAYTFMVSGLYFTLVYFFPIYFQAVRDSSAVESGIRNIPLILGVSLFTIVSTSLMARTRQWMPLFVVGALLMVAGSALILNLGRASPAKEWIGFQALVGIGVGISMEIALVANQKNLPFDDIPATIGLTMFFELAGGAVFVSAGEAIFANGLLASLRRTAPSLDGAGALHYGALDIGEAFGAEATHVVDSYMVGLRQTFTMVLVCATVTAAIALMVVMYEYVLKIGDGRVLGREASNEYRV